MKKNNKSLTIVSMLMIILLTFGCQSRKNAGYLHTITDAAHLNYPAINTEVAKDLEKNWFTGLFTKEAILGVVNAVTQASTGNLVGAGTTMLGIAGTLLMARKNKQKFNLIEEIGDLAFDKADPELKTLTQKLKKGKKNA